MITVRRVKSSREKITYWRAETPIKVLKYSKARLKKLELDRAFLMKLNLSQVCTKISKIFRFEPGLIIKLFKLRLGASLAISSFKN